LYAFDPGRAVILLIGGDKSGDGRWYEVNLPIADRLSDEHLKQLRNEGLIDG
ncbi:MAG: type II toxin-antitoxin system RelE/ParE family toxin, partial [Rhodoferax sp.]|nr:type II toxin-antitoxin system RelE/ParE family toxin [Rhodoferax sp.]